MNKTVNITDGSGSIDLVNGNYNVSANVNGYENSSIEPSTLNVVEGTNEYSFTISATGTLTLHVTEDGTSSGTPVVGATFIRTDSQGNEYGSVITTNDEGNAIFNNVPFAETDAPLIYYKQTASDGNHEFSNVVSSTSLTTSTFTVEIENARGALRNINLDDANYSGLKISTGTLTLNN